MTMRARAITAPIGIAEEADKEVAEEEASPSIFMWWNAKGGEFPPPLPRVNCGLGVDVNPSKAKAQEAGAYPTIA